MMASTAPLLVEILTELEALIRKIDDRQGHEPAAVQNVLIGALCHLQHALDIVRPA